MMKGFLKPESRLPRDEKEIARFILRHPAFNGGWLLFLAAEIHERSRTHNSITVTVSVDNYLSWMDIAVSGLPELPINIIKQIQRFVDAPHFNDCLSQSGRTFTFQQ